ncbi:MAG TPA: hypothetical protein VHY08_13205 [Bacillota bacterium]|nr:hypothetical protein [Bacillota bacterium]
MTNPVAIPANDLWISIKMSKPTNSSMPSIGLDNGPVNNDGDWGCTYAIGADPANWNHTQTQDGLGILSR